MPLMNRADSSAAARPWPILPSREEGQTRLVT